VNAAATNQFVAGSGVLIGFSERLASDMLNSFEKKQGKGCRQRPQGATNSFAVTTSSVAAHQGVLTDEESLAEPRPKWTNNPALVLHWRPDAIPADASQLTVTGEGSL
jgi:hypothetical protein